MDKWYFVPGRHLNISNKIHTPKFHDNIDTLISQQRIHKGWISVTTAKEKFELAKIMKAVANRMQLLHTNDMEDVTDDKIIDFIHHHLTIVYNAKSTVITLDNPNPPSGPHLHKFMTPNDKEIWDNSYILNTPT